MHLTPTKTPRRALLIPYWRAAAACVLVLAAYVAAIKMMHTETTQRGTAPPWYAWARLPLTRTRWQCVYVAIPAVLFAAWFSFVRRISRETISRNWLLPSAFIAVFLMNTFVAMMDGSPKAIWIPFNRPGEEYFFDVPAVKSVGSFLRGYAQHLYLYHLHTRTHPPGPVLLLYFISRAIGPTVVVAAWSAVAITATAVVPFFLLARRLAGEKNAAIAAALYVVTPSLVLFGATSMDGIILVPLLWAMYFLLRTINEPGLLLAIAAGISLTISLIFSYATVCVGTMMLIYAAMKIAANPSLARHIAGSFAVCAGLILVFLFALYRASGFDYLACLHASRIEDHYQMRTFHMTFFRYVDICLCNLTAFLVGVGVAAGVLWGRETIESIKPRTDGDRFNLALVISVLIFSFAGLFTRETERIWLFFMPPALIAAATWIARRDDSEQKLLEWAMCLSFVQTWLFQLLLYTIW
jgi:hypothetical protein